MTKKQWRKREGIVYSTDPDFNYDYGDAEQQATLSPNEQKLRVVLDKKQRAGKIVTLVTGFIGSNDDLKQLGRELKQACGVGGSAKDGEIIVQGDFKDKIAALLSSLGYDVKKIG